GRFLHHHDGNLLADFSQRGQQTPLLFRAHHLQSLVAKIELLKFQFHRFVPRHSPPIQEEERTKRRRLWRASLPLPLLLRTLNLSRWSRPAQYVRTISRGFQRRRGGWVPLACCRCSGSRGRWRQRLSRSRTRSKARRQAGNKTAARATAGCVETPHSNPGGHRPCPERSEGSTKQNF